MRSHAFGGSGVAVPPRTRRPPRVDRRLPLRSRRVRAVCVLCVVCVDCRVNVHSDQCVSFLSADSRAEVLGNGAEGADRARRPAAQSTKRSCTYMST